MSEKTPSFDKKEIVPKKQKDVQAVVTENTRAKQELAKSIKKEKTWEVGLGTTQARHPDGKMEISTTGVKIRNKKNTLEATIGVANVYEQKKP